MIRSIETGAWKTDPFFGIKGSGIALIDADSLLYYCAGSSALEGDFSKMRLRLDELILGILQSTQCSRYSAFLTDSGNLFRSAIARSKPYKGNRAGKEAPLLLSSLKAYAIHEWGFYICPNLEADDCVAYHATDTRVVCSPDKDVLRQIPGKHFNYQKREWVSTSPAEARRFLWTQTLTGDGVDGIPGIPGTGPSTADKVLDKVDPSEYPEAVLRCYLAAFQETEAVARFYETYQLVRLLSGQRDYDMYGISPPALNIFDASGLARASIQKLNADQADRSTDPADPKKP